ncbi:uncharacterized protein EDB91DRAFT_344863 [Suillus paluster]|uniref:uncharacterized protein n=1 Tax=Suillus paluster TaxID=48578 RepID=UPI001B87BB03|nr:uncharacterized protein EDB91DRAFT_344863 [Suillus paluster]KAG1740891.1 hypothetical protein EDB91DRAFT_344863 [Suillus paluster]
MDPTDPSCFLYGSLEVPACHTSISACQTVDSHHDSVPLSCEMCIHSEHLSYQSMTLDTTTNTTLDYGAPLSFENRSITVADGPAYPSHVLHEPQPILRPIYRWYDSAYTGSCSPINNQTVGLSILRPSAPSPMQDNPLHIHRNVPDNPPSHPPPRNHGPGRFDSYHIERPHKSHSTYLCRWDNEGRLCSHEFQATSKDILAHLREHHRIGVDNKEFCRCLWVTPHGVCKKQLKIQSLGRHVITHIGIRLKCSVCGITMARNDCAAKHRKQHPGCSRAHFIEFGHC